MRLLFLTRVVCATIRFIHFNMDKTKGGELMAKGCGGKKPKGK